MTYATTTGHFAKEQGEKLLRHAAAQIARSVRSTGTDEIHDLRVAIRRFTTILNVLKPCFPRGESQRIRRGLKRIMSQAGHVRDHDVALQMIEKMALPESGPLVKQFREGRDEAAGILTASLRRWGARNLPARWRDAQKSDSRPKDADRRFRATPVEAAAARILPDLVTEHFRQGKNAARHKASVRDIHRFRIALKNFRYTIDFFTPLYGNSLAGLLAQLKDVQTLLGDIHDSANVRHMVSRLRASPGKEGGKKSSREVLSELKKRQRKKTEQFRNSAEEFSSAAVVRQWKDCVGHPTAEAPAEKKPPVRKKGARRRPAAAVRG